MNRLRDEAGSDPISEHGIGILRGAPATSSAPELKRRVWAALQQAPVVSTIGWRPLGGKAVALGVAAVAIAATAGAAIGGRWIASRSARPGATAVSTRASRPQHWRGTAARRIASAPEASEIAPPLPSAAPVEPPLTIAPPAAGRTAVATPSRKAAPSAQAGRTEVLDALIALRRDHDADRAARLLDRYLSANRRGALREEALVLAIEAADTRHDEAHARVLARAYQIEFPAGRFVSFAHHHLIPSGDGDTAEAAPPPR